MLQVAYVEEAACIGCAACYKVCPTGALVGAPKHIHSVLAELCTGCGACLPACPVPCITMVPWCAEQHPLQGMNAAKAEVLTARHATRLATQPARSVLQAPSIKAPSVAALPEHLAMLANAARARATQRQSAKGPRKRPLYE